MNIKNKISKETLTEAINKIFTKELIDKVKNLSVIFAKPEHFPNEMINGSLPDRNNFYFTHEYIHECNKNCFKLRIEGCSEIAEEIHAKINNLLNNEILISNKGKRGQTLLYFWESENQNIPLTSFEEKIEDFEIKAKKVIKRYSMTLEDFKIAIRKIQILENFSRTSNDLMRRIPKDMRIAKKILKKIEELNNPNQTTRISSSYADI